MCSAPGESRASSRRPSPAGQRATWTRRIEQRVFGFVLLLLLAANPVQALPTATEGGALNALGRQLLEGPAARHYGASGGLLFALPTQTARGPSPALSRRLLAVIAGKLGLGQGRVISSAGVLGRQGGWVLNPRISGGLLSVALDLYPPQPGFWDRAKGVANAPTHHGHAAAAIDAEVQSFFPNATLTQPAVTELPLPTVATAAVACSGALRPRLVASSRREVVQGHYAEGKFIVEGKHQWAQRSDIHPFPLREPIITITPAPRKSSRAGIPLSEQHWVSSTDRAMMFRLGPHEAPRNAADRPATETPIKNSKELQLAHALPLALGGCLPRVGVGYAARVEICGTNRPLTTADAVWVQQALAAILVGNQSATAKPASLQDRALASPQVRDETEKLPSQFDVVVTARVRTPGGRLVNYVAARQVGERVLHLRSSSGMNATLPEVGAQVLLHDLNRDGLPEIVHASDAFNPGQDLVSVHSVNPRDGTYEPALQYALPVSGAITAIAACPPIHQGPAPLAVTTNTRLLYLETSKPQDESALR